MTNAASVRFFKWEQCSWTDGCEQAVFNPSFGADLSVSGDVTDDGTTVRVGISIYSLGQYVSTVAGDDGAGFDAIRVSSATQGCNLFGPSVWGKRFAIEVASADFKHFGGVLGDVGDMAALPTIFTIPEPSPTGSPQRSVLGDGRFLWWWTPGDRFSTVSSEDGSAFQIFAQVTASSSAVAYRAPTTTGQLFLAEEANSLAGGHVQHRIVYSDGVSPVKPYLVPQDPNDDYGEPAYANSHVGFLKGINQKDINVYDSVELWASPYTADPTALKPELVGAHPYPNMCPLVGGWGRLGTCAKFPPSDSLQEVGVAVWAIGTKTVKEYSVPKDRFASQLFGLTRTHIWVGANVKKGSYPFMMRFDVE